MSFVLARLPAAACLLGFFLGAAVPAAAETKSEVSIDWGRDAPPALAPIPPPPGLDAKYSGDALLAVFRAIAQQRGWSIRRVAVDTSEYPFLVHGTFKGRLAAADLNDDLKAFPDYTSNGSVSHLHRTGVTQFALNLTPALTYPPRLKSAIGSRLRQRLATLVRQEMAR